VSGTGLYTTEEIYRLLPAVYRVRDAEQGGVLRELVDVITEQVNVLAESLEQMYDDQFIETCAPWAAPYIGDLVGYRTLHGVVPQIASPRAEVANTIRYRRRKGTVSVLEQLARDVTGWPAHAVEFFELLATTQYMNHVRRTPQATADLRDEARLELAGTFQAARSTLRAHGRDAPDRDALGPLQHPERRHLPLARAGAAARRARRSSDADGSGRASASTRSGRTSRSSRSGAPSRRSRTSRSRSTCRCRCSAASRRRTSRTSTARAARSCSRPRRRRRRPDPRDVRICDLSDDPATPGAWAHEPQPGDTHVASTRCSGASPSRPRRAGETALATFHYGSALAIGGGGYDRASRSRSWTRRHRLAAATRSCRRSLDVAGGGAVQILDSRRYDAPATITATTPRRTRPTASSLRSVEPRAAAAHARRPAQARDGSRRRRRPERAAARGRPLVIEESADAEPRKLVLRHCTLVPGHHARPDGDAALRRPQGEPIVLHPFANVTLDHCVVGQVVAGRGRRGRGERQPS
jgi:hypothetical protein